MAQIAPAANKISAKASAEVPNGPFLGLFMWYLSTGGGRLDGLNIPW